MIPKIIHFCWLSGDPYPPLVLHCISTWKTVLPDYKILLWDASQIDIHSSIWLEEACQAKKYAFAADYIRLYALYNYGGIYLDSDVEVLKSFNDLLHLKSFIGYDSTNAIEAAIIGAEKGQEWIKSALEYYDNRHFIDSNGNYDMRPIPRMIYSKLHQFLSFKDCTTLVLKFPEISIFPSEYFSPKNYQTKQLYVTENTYTIHHFDGKWISQTLNSKVKSSIHILLNKFFGNKMHYYVVNGVRNIKKIFR